MNFDAILEGRCPSCSTELERRDTDGWCPTCKVGWATWSRDGEGEVAITLELDIGQFRDGLEQASRAFKRVGRTSVRISHPR